MPRRLHRLVLVVTFLGAVVAPATGAQDAPPPPATFVVTYDGAVPSDARAAFEYAIDIWAERLAHPLPIDVVVTWGPGRGGASGSPATAEIDSPGVPVPGVWYPGVLVDKFAGEDRIPERPEIEIEFNGETDWHYGTDQRPGRYQMDFVTVALHELAHGLGFGGWMHVSDGVGSWGFGSGHPGIYDTFTQLGDGTRLLELPNESRQLGDALTSGDVWFAGPNAVAANDGRPVRLWAPSQWAPSSSYQHLDPTEFPGNVMAFGGVGGEANHEPGAVVLGMLADLGWEVRPHDAIEKPDDTASVKVLGGRAAVSDETIAAVGRATSSSPVRIAGEDRFATAARVVADAFETTPVDTVYVATGSAFPDALAGSAAAAVMNAPVVLVSRDVVPEPSEQQLLRLTPRNVKVLGGRAAVSDAVLAEVGRLTSTTPQRLSGTDRFATAAAVVADAFSSPVETVYVATGAGFADALAGSAAAARADAPVLLVQHDAVPAPVAEQLERLRPGVVKVLGGRGAVSDAAVEEIARITGTTPERLSGADRYATAARIVADAFTQPAETIYVATGEAFPDALAGSAAAASRDAPILLVRPDAVPPAVEAELRRLSAR